MPSHENLPNGGSVHIPTNIDDAQYLFRMTPRVTRELIWLKVYATTSKRKGTR